MSISFLLKLTTLWELVTPSIVHGQILAVANNKINRLDSWLINTHMLVRLAVSGPVIDR